mgnify:CR=1 FL=1
MNARDSLKTLLAKALKSPVINRRRFEREIARRLGDAWEGQRDALMKLLGDPPSLSNVPESYWNNGGKAIRQAVTSVFESIYIAQAEELARQAHLVVDWELINQKAIEWAGQHAGELIKNWANTNRNTLTQLIQRYYTDDWTLADLAERLAPLFGERRALTIAITETTQAAVQSQMATARELMNLYGVQFTETWRLSEYSADSCTECIGNNHHPTSEVGYPPAHINCACYVEYEVLKV